MGNTLLVYNKTTIVVCADPPAPRATPPPPEPGAIGPPCSTAGTGELIPLAPLRACPSVSSSMYGTPIICKSIYGNLLRAKTCMRHLLCTSPRAPGEARDPQEQKGDSVGQVKEDRPTTEGHPCAASSSLPSSLPVFMTPNTASPTSSGLLLVPPFTYPHPNSPSSGPTPWTHSAPTPFLRHSTSL